MSHFTFSEPYIYRKDKKGKVVKKWCVRYSIQYGDHAKDYVKEYGNSYKIDLNRIRDLKKKLYEADVLLARVLADLNDGVDPRNREIELEEKVRREIADAEQYIYMDVYRQWYAAKNYINPIPSKEITAKNYKRFQENQFIPYLRKIGKAQDIRLITDEDLNGFIQEKYQGGQWSARTCNDKIGWLAGVFKFAYKKKLIPSDPIVLLSKIEEDKLFLKGGEYVLKEKKEPRFNIFTDKELEIIFKKFYDTPNEVICKIIHYSFLRFSEICRIKLGHIDLDNACINIPAHIAKGQRDGSTHTLPVFPNLKEALVRYIDKTFGNDRDPNYYLFFQNNNKFLASSYSIFQHHWLQAMNELRMEDVVINKRPYGLKHTGVKKYIENAKKKGYSSYAIIEAVMKQVRHANWSTTEKYIYGDLGIDLESRLDFSFD